MTLTRYFCSTACSRKVANRKFFRLTKRKPLRTSRICIHRLIISMVSHGLNQKNDESQPTVNVVFKITDIIIIVTRNTYLHAKSIADRTECLNKYATTFILLHTKARISDTPDITFGLHQTNLFVGRESSSPAAPISRHIHIIYLFYQFF